MNKSRKSRIKRLAVVAVIAVLAGYGLFLAFVFTSLHTQPGIGSRDGSMRVRNCEAPRDENAEGVCPRLTCEKAISESGRLRGTYDLHRVRAWRSGEGAPRIHGGAIHYADTAGGQAPAHYLCKTGSVPQAYQSASPSFRSCSHACVRAQTRANS